MSQAADAGSTTPFRDTYSEMGTPPVWKDRALRAEAQVDRLQSRLDQLTDKLLARQDPSQPPPYSAQALPTLTEEIQGAILDRAGALTNDRARELATFALGQLAAKVEPAHIVQRILNGDEGGE